MSCIIFAVGFGQSSSSSESLLNIGKCSTPFNATLNASLRTARSRSFISQLAEPILLFSQSPRGKSWMMPFFLPETVCTSSSISSRRCAYTFFHTAAGISRSVANCNFWSSNSGSNRRLRLLDFGRRDFSCSCTAAYIFVVLVSSSRTPTVVSPKSHTRQSSGALSSELCSIASYFENRRTFTIVSKRTCFVRSPSRETTEPRLSTVTKLCSFDSAEGTGR